MSSVSTLTEIAVGDLPYFSSKQKIPRRICADIKLCNEFYKPDLTANDIIKWEHQLINAVYSYHVRRKGCASSINLDTILLDKYKNVMIMDSNINFVNEAYESDIRVLKTMLTIHDDIFEMIAECQPDKLKDTKISILNSICNYFYSTAVTDTSGDILYNFINNLRMLFNMVHEGLLNDITNNISNNKV